MKRKAARNKPDGTRIPENQKEFYYCKANGHIAKNCPEKTTNKKGNSFFIGMCEEEEEEEPEKEDKIGHCPNCGNARQVGLECIECKDSGLIYKNEYGMYCQPETQNAQDNMTQVQPRTMELAMMTKLCKENDKLTEKERTTGLEYGWCIECDAVRPMYTMCLKCQVQGQTSTHTRKICGNTTEVVYQLGDEEQDLSEWLIDSGASVHMTNKETDLEEAKPMMQAITIGNGNLIAAKLIRGQKTVL